MNPKEIVEGCIDKDFKEGFASGFFENSWFKDNTSVVDEFKAHARIVAVNSIAKALEIPEEEAWKIYHRR